jgi:opacity protein-like surface antigen
MRRSSCIGFAVLLLASLASAQVPTSGNVFFGYSYYNADLSSLGRSNLNGWTGSLEGKIFPHVGLVADFSQTFGSENVTILCPGINCPITENISAHEFNILFGPRVSFSVGKWRPFAEALFGAGHVSTNSAGSNTSFATALGGGIDYRIFRPIALRFEGDYLQTRVFSATQNNVRLSTGIVFRF